jgi:hypothetical protein
MTAKQTLVSNALAEVEAVQEKRRHHLEAGRIRLADAFLVELEKANSILSFMENLSDKDAETVKRLLA